MPLVPVIAGVGFTKIPVGIVKLELTARHAEIVARNYSRACAQLQQQSTARVAIMEISAERSN